MIATKFSEQERLCFYSAILHLDSDKEFVIVDKDKDILTYNLKNINSGEKISGKPTDEELTRCLILLNLIKNYGYNPESMEIEDRFSIGGRREEKSRGVETDIIIKNKQGHIEIICEVKRIHNYKGVDDDSIKKQLFHLYNNLTKYNSAKYLFYLSLDIPLSKDQFPLKCIGIDTKLSPTYDEWREKGKTPHLVDIVKPDEKPVIQNIFVKLTGEEENIQKQFKDLNDNFGIDELRRIWRNLWDEIWSGTLEDNKKFENFNKVLLAKIYDERKTTKGTAYQFQRKFKLSVPQTEEEIANDVDLLYRRAFREYLSKDKSMELKDVKGIDLKEFPPHLISKCVELLSPISFQKSRYQNVDVLGEFYEMVIREAFKQTKGLFLTHPNIVLFILAVLEVENLVNDKLRNPDEDSRYRLPFVIDSSCGTGTFLVHYMKYVQKHIDNNHAIISAGDDDIADFIGRQMLGNSVYKWVIDYVYGIDNEQVLATACQINMILHGDGSTNIYGTDGLDSFDNYSKLEVTGANNILSSKPKIERCYYSKSTIHRFDIVISNPPFNVNINKTYIKQNFEIAGKSEAYFLERWYQLLKPNGRIGVVLPESFFSVEEDVEGRLFLYKHFNIKAIVSLPNHTFSPHTTTSTSLLFASKKTEEQEEIFQEKWDRAVISFQEKYSGFNALLSVDKNNISFNIADKYKNESIKTLLKRIEFFLDNSFGQGFIIFPYFDDNWLFNDKNFNLLKKKIKDTVSKVRDRWVLFDVTKDIRGNFYNFSISNIGYKAGKKGSKDKPNELMAVYGNDGRRIYNLKYAHSWSKIDSQDENTVLGKLKRIDIWQS
ncbi:N-6 DNA methylase [Microcoleus sp. AT9_A2]|uniref:N-6 DNA methylase n=1 Tax=Microcoleus sp. AT9_A2 TaxID=2818624 RepID=UPI002FD66D79